MITFLQQHYGTNNLNKVSRKLKEETNIDCLLVNFTEVENTVKSAMSIAKNDKEFETIIKDHFNARFCKLESKTLIVADQIIQLSDLNVDKLEIINKFRENRIEIDSSPGMEF